jgi:hypothetical protein
MYELQPVVAPGEAVAGVAVLTSAARLASGGRTGEDAEYCEYRRANEMMDRAAVGMDQDTKST